MSRLDAIQKATRPKMHGRALISGPSGAGKTWTSLSMARHLAEAEGDPSSVLVIDTERESALTYADVFTFDHLPWRPPYDPGELASELDKLGDRYHVVTIDSLSHFWRGPGGTLDIADGRIGGWKAARPVQESLIQALLAVPAHLLLCVRSKMEYLIEDGGRSVSRQGMAAIQDDTLVYEVNIALDIDMEHRITVTKSRTVAVPVGRMYPAGLERKAAEDYAEWLAGGVPPASRADVDQVVGAFSQIIDKDVRITVKQEFVQLFGSPHSLTADSVVDAHRWLAERLATLDAHHIAPTGPSVAEVASEVLAMTDEQVADYLAEHDPDDGLMRSLLPTEGEAEIALELAVARWLLAEHLFTARSAPPVQPSLPLDGPETSADAPESAPQAEDAQPPPDPPTAAQGDTGPPADHYEVAIAHLAGIDKRQVVLELGSHGLATTGNEQSMRKRLALFYAEHPDQLPKVEGS